MAKKVNISYTSREFDTIKNDLINYARTYYPETFKDFSEASFGSLMLDTVAYVGDILSYTIDYQTNESFLSTAIERRNINKLAEQLGYKQKNNFSARGKLAIYVLLPATQDGSGPELAYAPIIKKGSVFTAASNEFILLEDVDFNKPNLQSVVAKVNQNNGNPTYYALKSYGEVISGIFAEETFPMGVSTKNVSMQLSADNIDEIISIKDTEGNDYFEVDYLSQNVIFKELPNNNSDSDYAPSVFVTQHATRRFIVGQNSGKTTIRFGGSGDTEIQNLRTDYLTDPSRKVLDLYGSETISDQNFDPYRLVENNLFGIAPINTTITVKYRYNPTQVSAQPDTITGKKLVNLDFRNRQALLQSTIQTVFSSIEVTNEEAITANNTTLTNEEFKDLILSNYHSQNRIVTQKDYESACYTMPSKFGSIKRARAFKDPNSLKNNINLYVVSNDANDKFMKTTSTTKSNLKKWLNKNRPLTDSVDIMDAKIINFGVEFSIIADDSIDDPTSILNKCVAQLKFYFGLKSQIGQPISYTDILRELRKIKGLLDVKNLQITNITATGYSSVKYDVKKNTTADERFVLIPNNAVYEIKNPDVDIKGTIL